MNAAASLDLAGRRELLRQALQGDPADFSGFAAAVAGATAEDRAALARTLPPSRLFKAEGPTPRACFVVAALGRPTLAAETLAPFDLPLKQQYSAHRPAMVDAVLAAALERDPGWLTEFVDVFAERGWWGEGLVWPVCRRLVHDRRLPLESVAYLSLFVLDVTGENHGGPPADHGDRIRQRLLAEPELHEELWALFRVEGCGASYPLTDYCAEAWSTALGTLGGELPGFRDRLLDESLRALLRDFSARNILWYHRLHRFLDPSPTEVAERQHDYLAVLATTPSVAVGLAQDLLGRAVARLDPAALIDASPAVLGRSEKKLIKAQLGLLRALVRTDAAHASAVGEIVSGFLGQLPPELAVLAGELVATTPDAPPDPSAVAPGGSSVPVPGPRARPLPPPPDRAPLIDQEDLLALVAELLEGGGDGADLPRISAYLAQRPVTLPAALRRRAHAILTGVPDDLAASPRRHLARILLVAGGEPPQPVHFRGFLHFEVFGENKPIPPEYTVETHTGTTSTFDTTGALQVIDEWVMRAGHKYLPTHAPLGLLPETLASGDLVTPLPPLHRDWRRVLGTPGRGSWNHQTTPGPVPLWLSGPPQGVTDFHRRLAGVETIETEFTLRVETVRGQDGYDRIVEWAAWALRDDPDTLAALEHPALWAATQYPNIRGVGALLAALGATRRIPGGPVYSALALAASAKSVEPRAQAAEAIAQLGERGLLDPVRFAQEVAAHLADGFVMAGRLAATLGDAASIGALAGYRVLQTLAALLARLDGVNQAGKLVELTARLAADYGTPVAIPEPLTAKRKGGSALAVALRSLAAQRPHPTPLAEEAAAQARAALDDGVRR